MNKEPIAVGTPMFYESISHRGVKQGIHETKVSSAGRKYFEVEGLRRRFFLESLRSDTQGSSFSIQLYRTREEIEETNEREALHTRLKKEFDKWQPSLPLNTLRQLVAVLENPA